MTNFGEWVKRAQSWRVGVGIAMLAATAVFSLGAATNGAITNLKQTPERLDRLEVTQSVVVQKVDSLGRTIDQIFCVVTSLADDPDAPINPLDPCRRD